MPPIPDLPDGPNDQPEAGEYLVSYGKTGALGRFLTEITTPLSRGTPVVVQSSRGLEMGTVLRPAASPLARLVPSPGKILRLSSDNDRKLADQLLTREQEVFDHARDLAVNQAGLVEILDVEIFLDGQNAILQFLGGRAGDLEEIGGALGNRFGLKVFWENLALDQTEETEAGCGKPDCGRQAGGECTTCGPGGGCSSCGTGHVDLRAYFAHLRSQMEDRHRLPLL